MTFYGRVGRPSPTFFCDIFLIFRHYLMKGFSKSGKEVSDAGQGKYKQPPVKAGV